MSAPTSRSISRSRRSAVVGLLVAGLAGSGLIAAAPAAAGPRVDPQSLSPSDLVVHDNLDARSTARRLGPDLAGVVMDASGQLIWQRTPLERQIPASNTKLVTAVNALHAYGPTARISTSAVLAAPEQVVLVGGGDPSLSRGRLRTLAVQVATTVLGTGVPKVRVGVDDTLFPAPSLAAGWQRSYVPRDVSAVRALVVDQHRSTDTSLDAGRVFVRLLRAAGLRAATRVTHLRAPAGAPVLGTVTGAPMSSMVATMLRDSDNDYAEVLHRLVALKAGFAPTWEGARLAQRLTLLQQGVDLGPAVLNDGSGLSRRNRVAPTDLARVLALAFDGAHPDLASLQHNSLAVAGRTGTLGPRFRRFTTRPTRCAAGLIEAKTGSLSGVISLSGFARGADGQVKLFSFLLNRVPSTLATRQAVDRLASTVTGCW